MNLEGPWGHKARASKASESEQRPGMGLVAGAVLVGAVALLLAAGTVAAEELPVAGTLPGPRGATTAIWDGQAAYVFGGHDGISRLADVVRFDPSSGQAEVVSRLPVPVQGAVAVWTGEHAFVFGGQGAEKQVLRFTPSTAEVVQFDLALEVHVAFGSAVWDGRYAYIFGGAGDGGPYSNVILRFDPQSNSAVKVGDLPSPRAQTSAAWDGRYAYIFGGEDVGCCNRQVDDILRFDPATGKALRVARLPTPLLGTSAIWAGTAAYIFPGAPTTPAGEVLRFDPTSPSGVAEKLEATIRPGRTATSAVTDGRNAYVFGGFIGGSTLADILRLQVNRPEANIAPVPPQECVAGQATVTLDGRGSRDPEGRALSFRWSAPGIQFDDAALPMPTATFPLGSTLVQLTVSDGFLEDSDSAIVRVVDTVPPRTVAGLDGEPGANGWWVSDVRASLLASDACGVAATFVSVDGSPFEESTTADIAGDAADHSLRYFSTDVGGNAEDEQRQAVSIDATKPAGPIVDPRPGKVYVNDHRVQLRENLPKTLIVGDKTIRVDAEDDTSGVWFVDFYVDNAWRWRDSESPYEFSWPSGSEAAGEHVLAARTWDVAGNSYSATIDVVSVPTAVRGVGATADAACQLALSPAVCGQVPSLADPPVPLVDPGNACRMIVAPSVCSQIPTLPVVPFPETPWPDLWATCRMGLADSECSLALEP